MRKPPLHFQPCDEQGEVRIYDHIVRDVTQLVRVQQYILSSKTRRNGLMSAAFISGQHLRD